MLINQKINTPIGDGITQGQFGIKDANGEEIVSGVMVRLPINETTRSSLTKSNCITPRAIRSGLWVFQESELQACAANGTRTHARRTAADKDNDPR